MDTQNDVDTFLAMHRNSQKNVFSCFVRFLIEVNFSFIMWYV